MGNKIDISQTTKVQESKAVNSSPAPGSTQEKSGLIWPDAPVQTHAQGDGAKLKDPEIPKRIRIVPEVHELFKSAQWSQASKLSLSEQMHLVTDLRYRAQEAKPAVKKKALKLSGQLAARLMDRLLLENQKAILEGLGPPQWALEPDLEVAFKQLIGNSPPIENKEWSQSLKDFLLGIINFFRQLFDLEPIKEKGAVSSFPQVQKFTPKLLKDSIVPGGELPLNFKLPVEQGNLYLVLEDQKGNPVYAANLPIENSRVVGAALAPSELEPGDYTIKLSLVGLDQVYAGRVNFLGIYPPSIDISFEGEPGNEKAIVYFAWPVSENRDYPLRCKVRVDMSDVEESYENLPESLKQKLSHTFNDTLFDWDDDDFSQPTKFEKKIQEKLAQAIDATTSEQIQDQAEAEQKDANDLKLKLTEQLMGDVARAATAAVYRVVHYYLKHKEKKNAQ